MQPFLPDLSARYDSPFHLVSPDDQVEHHEMTAVLVHADFQAFDRSNRQAHQSGDVLLRGAEALEALVAEPERRVGDLVREQRLDGSVILH